MHYLCIGGPVCEISRRPVRATSVPFFAGCFTVVRFASERISPCILVCARCAGHTFPLGLAAASVFEICVADCALVVVPFFSSNHSPANSPLAANAQQQQPRHGPTIWVALVWTQGSLCSVLHAACCRGGGRSVRLQADVHQGI